MAKATVQQTADVYVGSQSQHGLTVWCRTGAEAAFYVHVKAKKLTVRVAGTAAPVKFTVHRKRHTVSPRTARGQCQLQRRAQGQVQQARPVSLVRGKPLARRLTPAD